MIMTILTSNEDNFLYDQLLRLLYQIKIVQGVPAVTATLRRHSSIKQYLIQKQVDKLKFIEDRYFIEGDLDHSTIHVDSQKYSLHK